MSNLRVLHALDGFDVSNIVAFSMCTFDSSNRASGCPPRLGEFDVSNKRGRGREVQVPNLPTSSNSQNTILERWSAG